MINTLFALLCLALRRVERRFLHAHTHRCGVGGRDSLGLGEHSAGPAVSVASKVTLRLGGRFILGQCEGLEAIVAAAGGRAVPCTAVTALGRVEGTNPVVLRARFGAPAPVCFFSSSYVTIVLVQVD